MAHLGLRSSKIKVPSWMVVGSKSYSICCDSVYSLFSAKIAEPMSLFSYKENDNYEGVECLLLVIIMLLPYNLSGQHVHVLKCYVSVVFCLKDFKLM